MGRCLLDSCGSVYGPAAVSYEHGNETSVLIKYSRTDLYGRWLSGSVWSVGGKFVENYTKLTCLEIAGYRIKYSTVLWLLEHQIRRDRKV
jgi:hypothetical protein